MTRLKNKIALITGAASGIGEAIAKLFCSEGAMVILSDIQDEAGRCIADQLGESGEYYHLDVAEEQDWIQAFNYIEKKYGHLDILVNNAGITGFMQTAGPHDPEHLDLQSWHKVHAVNSDGVALGCKYAIGLMKQHNGGSIINMSSRSGLVGIPAVTHYAASKAAVRNHTKSVALYCAEQGYQIRCNSIHPGAILTPMWEVMFGEGKEREVQIKKIASEIPIGRMGTALDVAYGALYLASDESQYVTGIELNIDGGLLAGSLARPDRK